MAETVNPTKTPEPTPAVPAVPETATVPEEKKPKAENAFLKYVSRLMTTTFWFSAGLGFIFLGILFRMEHLIPHVLDPLFNQFLPHLPFFFAGIGFLCLGQARHRLQMEYVDEYKKNRQFSHAWKIPLIIGQVLILRVLGIYGIAVGVKYPPIKNLIALTVLLSIFLAYVLWYVVELFRKNFPSIAALRIAMMAFFLSMLALFFWSIQLIFVGLLVGFFALLAALSSLAVLSADPSGQKLILSQLLFVILTISFLAWIGLNANPYGHHVSQPVNLGLAAKDPNGNVGIMAYSPDGRKIAFSLKGKEGWFLQLIDAEDEKLTFKIPAGEDFFRPVFVDGGKALMLDAVKGGERGLWKVNTTTGNVTILKRQGVQSFGDGTPWSQETGEFLYVSGNESQYQLHVYPQPKGKNKPLFTSNGAILTPSWLSAGKLISYTDGTHGYFFVLDPKTGKNLPLLSDQETVERQKLNVFPVKEVLPAPDDFRFLYLTEKDQKTILWAVLMDGSKRKEIYSTYGSIRNLTWFPDGQKILLEENPRRHWMFYPFGFLTQTKRVRILDANVDSIEDLIPPQISNWSPTVSPNGVKVAFVADQGMWFQTFNSGIWVSVLR